MSGLEWILVLSLGAIYIALLATVAIVTLRKGYIAVFVIGFFFPIAWLVGSMLKPKPGSNYRGPL